VQPLDLMLNHHTNILFFEMSKCPRKISSATKAWAPPHHRRLNAERILIASEAIGDGRWFVERAAKYSSERVVSAVRSVPIRAYSFYRARLCPCRSGRPHAQRRGGEIRPRREMRRRSQHGKAARLRGRLGSRQCLLDAHGGYGSRANTTVERKFRETRLYITAPINNNLVLAFFGPERAWHAEILLERTDMEPQKRLYRSWMFVPGDRQRMIDKALALNVDAIMMDIEDGVTPMEKENARRQIGYSLDQVAQRLKADPKYRTPARFVRTNAVGTTRMIEDFKAVVRHGLEGLVIPKVDTVEQVRIVEDELGRDEVASTCRAVR